VLEINLSALTENVKHYKTYLKPDVKLMAMVKASSYGCGGYEVAAALENSGYVDYLAVAFADEGVELRNNGIGLPIMVMSPEKEAIENIIRYDLEPEIYSLAILNEMIEETECNKPLSIHLKLDTGMHRLGIEKNDIDAVVEVLKNNPHIKIKSIFSHLLGSDNPDLDSFTLQQIALFEQNSSLILRFFDYPIIRHLANSTAITRFPAAHYDMVRLGVGMYGIGANEDVQNHLKYVHKLRTSITQIRTIEKGESVSYNRNFVAHQRTTIGVIPIGYADGLNRRLGNGAFSVWVNGALCPIIGNICMDMCMINLNGIEAERADEVIIFSELYPVSFISESLQTIPYEVFTSVSSRVKRVYYQD
jgi:alanine racemase